MIVPRSVPGNWFAVVTDGVAVLLPPATPAAVLDDVWLALRDGARPDEVRDLVGESPSCGIVSVVGGTVEAQLRGDVVLTVSADDGQQMLRGDDSRWSAHTLGDIDGLLLEAVGAQRGSGGPLPVLAAVVPSAAVELGLNADGDLDGDGIDDLTFRRVPQGSAPAESLADVLDADDDTVLKVTPALRAEVEAIAAAEAHAAQAAGTELLERDGHASSGQDVAFDEDHLDAMTVLGVGPSLRAEVDARAAAADAAVVTAASPVDAAPSAPSPPVVPVADARPVPPPPPVAASTVVHAPADHDGMTVMSSDLVEIRKSLPTWTGDRVPGPFAVPAERGTAKLVMSSGLVVTLERTVLIGRAPVVSRVPNRSLPRLVTVPSPHHDISRTHAQVQDDGDRVFVTDLHSTNGVVVRGGAGAPVRLAPGVPTLLSMGAMVDIGDGVTFSVVRDR
ncbi:FHA domain-containing protein [Sanguibacter sp. A247]|uniref:FHA domain-containing protein n=1 Tax=unclassified Sanguibacter TaxID=2645534 RepID=UPI003FD747E9